MGAADRGQARPDALGPRTGGLDRDGDTGSGIPSAIALRCAGVLLLISAMIVPLATTGVVAARGNVAVRELAFSRIAYALAVSVIVVSTAVELTPRLRYPARQVALVTGAVFMLTPLFLVGALELMGALVSPDALPPVLQDLPPRGEPHIGMWLLASGGALVVLSASGAAEEGLRRMGSLFRGVLSGRAESMAVVLGVAGVVLFIVGRYGTWMRIESEVADWNVVAQNAPVLGLVSLAGLAVCLLCVTASVIRPSAHLGAATVVSGWVVTFVPAWMLVVGAAAPAVTAPEWLRSRLHDWSEGTTELASGVEPVLHVDVPDLPESLSVHLVVGSGTTMLFAAGLLIGLSGLLFTRAACRTATGSA